MAGLASAFERLAGPPSREAMLQEALAFAGEAVARQIKDEHLEIRRPETDEELRALVSELWGVRIPDTQVCPNHSTPWRAFADAFFARSPVSVWHASRGFGGKTFLLALLGLTEAALLGADVNVLGGSGEQAARVHEYMGHWWARESAPRYLLASDPSKRETRLIAGNFVRALMASTKSVRGPHVARLRVDEVDECDLPVLDAALGQPMSQPGIPAQTVLSSTHQYADRAFTEVLKRAAERGWPVHCWCYRETLEPHGWLTMAEVERKRSEVTDAMWNSEYDLQEPSPESRAIATAKVAEMFRRDLGEFEGAPRERVEIEPPMFVCPACKAEEQTPGRCDRCGVERTAARYATGTDWAKKRDWTIIATFRIDCRPMRLVAFMRMGREPWPVMVAELDKRMARYGGTGVHDGTGVGDVVADYLTSDVEPFLMVGRARSDLLTEYIAAVERGELVAPYIHCAEAEHRLASVDDVFGADHLPDTIAAGALAYRAATSYVPLRGYTLEG
jgi:hypothetical protein